MTASPATTLAKHELTKTERDVVHDIFVLARERSLKVQAASRSSKTAPDRAIRGLAQQC